MRVLALFALVGTLAVPLCAQESASDDTAPPPEAPETTDALFGPVPEPMRVPEPEIVDEWVDVMYYRSLGPFMDSELFRFDARDSFSDESWLAAELRWNVPSNFLNQRLVRGAMGIVYERYTLNGERTERSTTVLANTRVHSVMLRQIFVRRPGKMVQPFFALGAGIGFENSSQKVWDDSTGYFTDIRERDRILFRWELSFGARIRPIRQIILNPEVSVPFYVSRTVTPGIQLVVGAGISY